MASPAEKPVHNIPTQKRGDTFKGFSFRWRIGENYVDFTGAQIKIQFRENSENGRLIHTSATTNPEDGYPWSAITIDGTTVAVAKFQTETWCESYLFYDVQVTWANGDRETLWSGNWMIRGDTTR